MSITRKKLRNTNTGRLNNAFLNNQQVTEEIKREIKKIIETNDNESTTQNLWDAAKADLRGKFTAIQSYLKKQEKHCRQPNFTPKTTGNKRTKTPQNQWKERNHKDQSRNKRKRNERNNSKD